MKYPRFFIPWNHRFLAGQIQLYQDYQLKTTILNHHISPYIYIYTYIYIYVYYVYIYIYIYIYILCKSYIMPIYPPISVNHGKFYITPSLITTFPGSHSLPPIPAIFASQSWWGASTLQFIQPLSRALADIQEMVSGWNWWKTYGQWPCNRNRLRTEVPTIEKRPIFLA